MAYYNANRVIKLTRKALGLTQEKLSEGVCEVETYSKIENGHRTLRRSTYQKLMEKMGRNTDRRYAVCVSKDGMLLDEKIELERAFKRYDYEAAEKYLNILKEKVDDNLLTRQYMARVEALVGYCSGRLSPEELINRLDGAIRITVPNYDIHLKTDKKFPFMKEELLALMGMAIAHRSIGNVDISENIYEKMLECLECEYLGYPDKRTLLVTVRRNRAKLYANSRRYTDAIREIESALELAKENDYGHKISALLVTMAHDYMKMMKRGECEEGASDVVSKYLRQAYYLATARGEVLTANKIKVYYDKYFADKK